MVRLLDSPIRIFRCPICVENGTDAPSQELSLVIEHLARHYEFYLFECRKCKDRFATPFLASFHIKEGRCKQEDGELSADGEKNEITKCIQNMLKQQSELILEMERKEVEKMNKIFSFTPPKSPEPTTPTTSSQKTDTSIEAPPKPEPKATPTKRVLKSPRSKNPFGIDTLSATKSDPGFGAILKGDEMKTFLASAPKRRDTHQNVFRTSFVRDPKPPSQQPMYSSTDYTGVVPNSSLMPDQLNQMMLLHIRKSVKLASKAPGHLQQMEWARTADNGGRSREPLRTGPERVILDPAGPLRVICSEERRRVYERRRVDQNQPLPSISEIFKPQRKMEHDIRIGSGSRYDDAPERKRSSYEPTAWDAPISDEGSRRLVNDTVSRSLNDDDARRFYSSRQRNSY